MTNRELVFKLQEERDEKYSDIHKEYLEKIKPLMHRFTIEEIEADGWVKKGIYQAGGREWFYEKGNKIIRVGMDEHYIMPYNLPSGNTRQIVDMEDLNYFFINNQ